jgi:hypothetical protein
MSTSTGRDVGNSKYFFCKPELIIPNTSPNLFDTYAYPDVEGSLLVTCLPLSNPKPFFLHTPSYLLYRTDFPMDPTAPPTSIPWKIPGAGTCALFREPVSGNFTRMCAGCLFQIAILCCLAAFILIPAAWAIPADQLSIPAPGDDPALIIPDQPTDPISIPSIAVNTTPGFLIRQYTFAFQKTNITVSTNVCTGLYLGAKNGDKFAVVPDHAEPEIMAPDYYRAFVDDPAQEPVYADLAGQFRAIRGEHGYSDDEYLELLTVFVQSLPYDTSAGAHPDTLSRFPVETLVDGTGDCDDKSVLLSGLLSREGHNVSLLLFIPEHHMAVGVAGDCLLYGDTGYTYIESTGVSFMGDVPKRLNLSEKYVTAGEFPQTGPITSSPVVIRVGSGQKNFSAYEAGHILARKGQIDARIAYLREEINTTSRENPPRFRHLLDTYNTFAVVHNTLGLHRYDRAGMYRYLFSLEPPACTGHPGSYPAGSAAHLPGDTRPGTSCPPITAGTDRYPDGYLSCPHGTWVPQACLWQSLRQEIISSC